MDELFVQLRERLRDRPGRALSLPGVSLREAAVLVPMFVRNGQHYVLFTRRPETLRTHAGQISFPGGSRDASDETPLHAALRETHEEMGIEPSAVEVLGMLDESPTITSFRIVPFVGVIPPDVVYRANAAEIAEILEVPLAHLLDRKTQRTERRFVRGAERDIYFYDYGPHSIWGATARIVKNLFDVAGDLPAFRRLSR